jgi:hypothetical protein
MQIYLGYEIMRIRNNFLSACPGLADKMADFACEALAKCKFLSARASVR